MFEQAVSILTFLLPWTSLPETDAMILARLTRVPHPILASDGDTAIPVNVPQFLSGRQAAVTARVHPPERWSSTENVAWKTDFPGLGWSTPIVWGNRVFLTTCVNTGQGPAPRKGLYMEDLDARKYPRVTSNHLWKVYCLDLATGAIIWERIAQEGIPAKPHHIKNTLASETPATDGERVYALFGNVGLFCYDYSGKLLWSYRIEPRDTQYGWGTSMSPIVHGDRIYFANDNQEESSLFALDKRTGKLIWRVPRDEKTNYSTPFIWENPVRTELVLSGINWVTSYDLAGKELWRIKGKSILAIPTPFEQFGLLYVTSGHVVFGENRFYAVRPGAAGDISPNEKAPLSKYIAWHKNAGPYHPTPLIIGEDLYVLFDRSFLSCYKAKTGEVLYDKNRIPNGRGFTSSPWSYAGKLFCVNEDGVTFVIKPGPEFKILYTNPLAEDDMCMATPIVVGDKLLIRSSKRLYCIQNRTEARNER
jgi:outer membrane protein assembly factor BamB